ncbi:kinase-like domain-containing protein [Daedaleopsis nitida]|nr:kinase-like domain-containing protein [Daedaleopsis nitida]
MFFKRPFGFALRRQPPSTAVKTIVISSKVEVEVEVDVEVMDEEVHVKMVLDEEGNVVMQDTERLRPIAVSSAFSTATTLVETQLPLPSPLKAGKYLGVADVKQHASTLTVGIPPPSLICTSTSMVASLFKVVSQTNPEPGPTARKVMKSEFEIVRRLGKGSQGFVSLVHHKATKKEYALKTFHKSATDPRAHVCAFIERDAMKRLGDNPWTLTLKAAFEDMTNFYVLMDFCPMGDLRTRMDSGPIIEDEARVFCAQLILGLQYLHSKRIMHRDLKPENILIDANNRLVVADFGLARLFGATRAEQSWREDDQYEHPFEDGSSPDETDTFCGTLLYASTERIGWGKYSPKVDIWAVGVIIFEMLLGYLPFGLRLDLTMFEVIDKLLFAELAVPDTVSEDAADFLRRTLVKDPGRRPGLEVITTFAWFDEFKWAQVARDDVPMQIDTPDGSNMTHDKKDDHANYAIHENDNAHPFFNFVSSSLQHLASASTTDTDISTAHASTNIVPASLATPSAPSTNATELQANTSYTPSGPIALFQPSPSTSANSRPPSASTSSARHSLFADLANAGLPGPWMANGHAEFDLTVPSCPAATERSGQIVAIHATPVSRRVNPLGPQDPKMMYERTGVCHLPREVAMAAGSPSTVATDGGLSDVVEGTTVAVAPDEKSPRRELESSSSNDPNASLVSIDLSADSRSTSECDGIASRTSEALSHSDDTNLDDTNRTSPGLLTSSRPSSESCWAYRTSSPPPSSQESSPTSSSRAPSADNTAQTPTSPPAHNIWMNSVRRWWSGLGGRSRHRKNPSSAHRVDMPARF